MKIVIALDSFKGSCSAQAACAAVAQGLRRVDQTLELVENARVRRRRGTAVDSGG
ncbi:glycerate kinase [Klebsiella pneumoniae]|uniref:Glycerate kinase n=1 Tax=Klebsiella pneumoniae TaxID=573 RepID=A0A2X3F834_KLEPN|nr:glycerate kinase [Klebsiella pneumoniae]